MQKRRFQGRAGRLFAAGKCQINKGVIKDVPAGRHLNTTRGVAMGRIIAVANQKGGVGMTTTPVNLSAALAEMKKKVLLVDMDPQGNATSGVGCDKNAAENTIYELLMGETTFDECLFRTEFENLYLLPANIDLSGFEIEIINRDRREFL